jgi:hypothetical protein
VFLRQLWSCMQSDVCVRYRVGAAAVQQAASRSLNHSNSTCTSHSCYCSRPSCSLPAFCCRLPTHACCTGLTPTAQAARHVLPGLTSLPALLCVCVCSVVFTGEHCLLYASLYVCASIKRRALIASRNMHEAKVVLVDSVG